MSTGSETAASPYTAEQIKLRPGVLKHLSAEVQTDELCLEAVSANGLVLRFVHRQTPEICLAAVKNDAWALEHVEQQTPDICLAAVQKSGLAIQLVEHQTPELCLAAAIQNGWALEHCQYQSPEICLAAVGEYSMALKFVKDQTDDVCLAAIRRNARAIQLVRAQTLPLCLVAIEKDSTALEYMTLPHDRMLDPGSGQLKDWLTLLSRCRDPGVDAIRATLYPLLASIPLGKQYGNEWQCAHDGQVTMLDTLKCLASEVNRLGPHDERIQAFCHQVNRQVEFALTQARPAAREQQREERVDREWVL